MVVAMAAVAAAIAACGEAEPPPVNGVVIPFPADGNQYRMSEVCQALQEQGYEVKGTLHHRFGPDSFEALLDALPSLARGPVENYLRDGLAVEVEVRSLCGALNR